MKYKSFEARNFRLFKDIKLDKLKRINLIAGKNNSGKTSLLEAIFIHSGYFNPELTMRIQGWRGTPGWLYTGIPHKASTPWDNLFYNFNHNEDIYLSSIDNNNINRKTQLSIVQETDKLMQFYIQPETNLDVTSSISPAMMPKVIEIKYNEDGGDSNYYLVFDNKGLRRIPMVIDVPYQTTMHPSRQRFSPKIDTDRFSKLKIEGKEKVLFDSLRIFDKRIKDVIISTIGQVPQLYIDIGLDEFIPLLVAGEGMVKIMNLVLEIYEASNGISLIDEFENGFHHTLLHRVWDVIDKASEMFNTQIFITTHSLENIQAAHKVLNKKDEDKISVYRIEKINNLTDVKYYDKKTLEASLKMGLEIR